MVGISKNVVKTSEKSNDIKSTLAAYTAASAVPLGALPAQLLAANKMSKISRNLDKDTVEIVNKAADDVLDKLTNLGKKGVKINNFQNAGINATGLPDKVLEIVNPLFATANGKNAFFTNKLMPAANLAANTVVVNRNKLSLSTFHELGHAHNFNNSKFWKAMQNVRTPSLLLASAFALLPALTKDIKPKDGEELTTKEKINNGLRKASPALAFLSMTPMLLEEGKATLNGNKWAKELLSPDNYKKVAKSNRYGYASYLASAASFALMAFVAKGVKDKFANKNEQKAPN